MLEGTERVPLAAGVAVLMATVRPPDRTIRITAMDMLRLEAPSRLPNSEAIAWVIGEDDWEQVIASTDHATDCLVLDVWDVVA